MRCLAQGHLDTQLGGAGNRTSNLAITGQPALPSGGSTGANSPHNVIYFFENRFAARLYIFSARGAPEVIWRPPQIWRPGPPVPKTATGSTS